MTGTKKSVPPSDPTGSVDLHTHSTYSDGTLGPSALVAEAARLGLRAIALTDHDTLAGLSEAEQASRDAGIEFISGVELSTDSGSYETHILGYFVDTSDEVLVRRLAGLAAQRVTRTERIVERLNSLGVPVTMQRVREIAGTGSIGRPHIARAIIEQGHASSVSDAFDRYLGSGRPGFVPRERTLPEDSVRMLLAAGALPVLAHPRSTGAVEATLKRLVPVGLVGMEVHYGEYDIATRNELAGIADRWNLIPTGGSDYHGPGFKEGRELGSALVPVSVARLLRERWELGR
jgi:predicted metal-dependent phosphoesterase TrpH